jgi:hypothetical protein
MRGFILNIRKAKNEDIVVTVLSNNSVESYYRFFGARHSILQVGNLIEFEIQESKNGFMSQLRKVFHISFSWNFLNSRMSLWQKFVVLFEPHLKDRTFIEDFYFNLLWKQAKKWERQSSKRLAVESYLEILKYEDRIYNNQYCFLCQSLLNDDISMIRGYRVVHPNCVGDRYPKEKKKIFELFLSGTTLYIEDIVVDELYEILLQGL